MFNPFSSDKPGPIYTLLSSVTPDAFKPGYELTHWVPGKTPMSTTQEVVIGIATYLAVIFGGRELMKYVMTGCLLRRDPEEAAIDMVFLDRIIFFPYVGTDQHSSSKRSSSCTTLSSQPEACCFWSSCLRRCEYKNATSGHFSPDRLD